MAANPGVAPSRRKFLSNSAAALAASSVACSTPVSSQDAAALQSPIVTAAARLGTLSRAAEALDSLRTMTAEQERELDALDRRVMALEATILDLPPKTPTEAVLILMHATIEINAGNAFELPDRVERGEFAAREAARVLADTLSIDLEPFNPDRYLPHINAVHAGKA